MKILQREQLVEGGFAGVTEHRLVKSPRVFGSEANNDGSWSGLGNFIYLADARFKPHGDTHMHDHTEVDVITVMVEGRIAHQGSLGHGQDLVKNDVQVQRAGGEGFSHNEVNPDSTWNRLLQIWVLPEESGQAAKYNVIRPMQNQLTRIYGGKHGLENDFPAETEVYIGNYTQGTSFVFDQPGLMYISRGKARLNDQSVSDGDLIEASRFDVQCNEDTQLSLISLCDSASR